MAAGFRIRLWVFQTLIVNSVVLVAFLAYGLFNAWELSRAEENAILRDVRNIAQSVAASATENVLMEAADQLEKELLQQVGLSAVTEMLVADAQGRVLAKAVATPTGVVAAYDEFTVAVGGAGEVREGSRYTLTFPVNPENPVGFVRLNAELERVNELRREIWLRTLLICLVTILVLATFQTLVLRRIGSSLEKIRAFARRMGGHTAEQLTTDSNIYELQELTGALNEVAETLARQYHTLVEEEARKAAMLEASLECFILVDDQNTILDFNQASEQVFGYTRREVLGERMAPLLLHAEYQNLVSIQLTDQGAPRETAALRKRTEAVAVRRDGNTFPVELTLVPFAVEDTNYALVAIRDVSEQKALEAREAQTEDTIANLRLESGIQSAMLEPLIGQCVLTREGRIVSANDEFARMLGVQGHRLPGALLDNWLASGQSILRHLRDAAEINGALGPKRLNVNMSGGRPQVLRVTLTMVPFAQSAGSRFRLFAVRA